MQDSNKINIKLDSGQKLSVLLHALEERYKSVHIIRERVQNISLWILGLFVTAGGWLLQSNTNLSIRQKVFFGIIILVSVFVLRAFYLSDLEKGFRMQQKIQAKIESILGLCLAGVFDVESVYPESWAKAGTTEGNGKFFSHNYLLIYLGTAILLFCIWFK